VIGRRDNSEIVKTVQRNKRVMEESEKSEKEDEKSEKVVWSWGAGTEGQLGTKSVQDEVFPQLLHQPSLPSISSLACGGAHVIALTSGITAIFLPPSFLF